MQCIKINPIKLTVKGTGYMEKETAKNTENSIEIIHDRNTLRVFFKNILYADTFRNAVYIHTDIGILKTYTTFNRFLGLLKGDRRFLNCFKGCVVNMDRIEKIVDYDFCLDNGEKVQIRKRGGKKVKNQYLQYLLS